MKNTGIIGQGFVGTAIREKLRENYNVKTFDRNGNSMDYVNNGESNKDGGNTINDLVKECDVIFVCVPTPMFEDGECDTRIVESVIEDIAKEAEFQNRDIITIIKSTIPPGTTERLNGISNKVGVTFSPEFLTEANATEDFKNQNRIVLGIDYLEYIKPIREIFETSFPKADIICINSNEAEMTKYTTNLFLATKVSFFNDINSICEKLGINYDNVIEATMHDPRIGKSHYLVPGPDGDKGFGGHCLPGHHKILTVDGSSLRLDAAFDKYSNGEIIEVISSDSNIESSEIKLVKEVTRNHYVGELIRFELEDGIVIKCTPSHIFPVNRNGSNILVQAKDILESDVFISLSDISNKKTMSIDANKILK